MGTTDTPSQTTLRTPADVLREFRRNGVTIAGWCREQGFSRSVVNALLHNGAPGLRGQSHKAAIALGLKPVPDNNLQGEADHEA